MESYLCLADTTGRVACFLQADPGGLKFISGTPGAEEKVSFILRELGEHGVHVRDERLSPGRIDVDMVKVGAGDPRFLEGCAAEFRLRGWSAVIYPKHVANVWRKLHVLPVPQELRASIMERLAAVTPDALGELETHLDRAAADFEKLAAERQ